MGRRLADRRGKLNIYKVKGVHKDDEKDPAAVLEGRIPISEFIGNLAADQCAGEIAAEAQLSQEDRAKVKEARTLAKAVQRRIAAALKQHLEARNADREKKARLPKEKPSQPNRKRIEQRRREATEHKLERLPCGTLRCTECGQNCAARAVKEWLGSAEGKLCARTRPTLQDHTRVEASRGSTSTRIGASFAHASHALALTAGTWWCQVCGAQPLPAQDGP